MKKINILKLILSVIFLSVTANAFANTPITIDGIKYTSYAMLSNTIKGSYVYTDFSKAINSGYSTIIVDEGTFYFTGTATLTRNEVLITGISKDKSKIIETNPTKDLLRIYSNKVTVKNLTLDTKTNNAQAAFVVGDGNINETTDQTKAGNNITLTNCNVLGGNKIFALYYAGPTYRDSIYTKYTSNKLNTGNVISNNYIEGSYLRDAFVFGLQTNGTIQNNTFVGGELDAYMVVNSVIQNNIFKNSNKTSIYISGPSYKLSILNNIIDGAKEHGIKSFYSIDNLPIPENLKYIQYSTISGNNISNVGETGIDLNYFISGSVLNNIVSNVGVHGISLITKSNSNNIQNNIISQFGQAQRFRGSGIFETVESTNNTISGNTITSDKQNVEFAGIFIETPDSTGSSISNNTIDGNFANAGIFSYTKNLKLSNNKITNSNGTDILYK